MRLVESTMSDENIYAAPNTDPTLPVTSGSPPELATLGERFLGALVDGLILLPVVIPVYFLTGVSAAAASGAKPGFLITAFNTILIAVIAIAIQYTFLKATGQTIGKKVMKTRIATPEGNKPEMPNLLKRYGFMYLLGIIPVGGVIISLVDSLMVFKADRRCLHDLIGDTKVVKLRPGEVIS
jgi:uncharacterized RDD family membrane protein YckC